MASRADRQGGNVACVSPVVGRASKVRCDSYSSGAVRVLSPSRDATH